MVHETDEYSTTAPSGDSSPDAIVVFCTAPADFSCESLATELVSRSLAACVQIGPSIRSVYRWKAAVETSEERLLIIKTRASCFVEVERAILERHPYDVPEIVALPVVAGHASYLAWLEQMTAR